MGQPGIDIVASSKQSRTVWHVCLQCQFGTKGGRCRSKCRGATKEVEVEAEQQNLVLLLAKRRRGASQKSLNFGKATPTCVILPDTAWLVVALWPQREKSRN